MIRRLSFLALPLLPVSALAFDPHKPFDVACDYLVYHDSIQVVEASGRAVVTQGDSKLHADFVRFDRAANQLAARGNVVWEEDRTVLYGDALDYDLTKQKGQVSGVRGQTAPWYFYGADWRRDGPFYTARRIALTTCDLSPPHTHFRSSRVTLLPNKRFWAWSNFGYLGDIPILWSPFFFRDLRENRITTHISPGHDNLNGITLKNFINIPLHRYAYDRIYIDYFSLQGWGVGNELNYSVPDRVKGSLYGYHIDARRSQVRQWNVRSYHWQRFSERWTGQSNINLLSTESFNNQFFRDDFTKTVRDIRSSLALTRGGAKTNFRFFTERQDAPDAGDPDPNPALRTQTSIQPGVEFNTYQLPLWKRRTPSPPLRGQIPTSGSDPSADPSAVRSEGVQASRWSPPLATFSSRYHDTFRHTDNREHHQISATLGLTQSIRLSRRFSFNPEASYQEIWQDKRDPGGIDLQGSQGRPTIAAGLRWKMLSNLDLDTKFTLTQRFKPDEFTFDRNARDHGVETKKLALFAFLRPGRTLMIRSFTSFDFRPLEDEAPETYSQRKWDPWSTELTFTPSSVTPSPLPAGQAGVRGHWQYFLRHEARFYPIRGNSWQAETEYSGVAGRLFHMGVIFSRGAPETLNFNHRITLPITSQWHLEATLDSRVVMREGIRRALKWEHLDSWVGVARHLHEWEARFSYRNRPPNVSEVLFNLSLRTDLEAQKKMTKEEIENQFYPWRRGRNGSTYP